jgi:hypothetical protein
MKRELSNRVKWSSEQVKLECLDWENNPKDFDALCEHVISKLNARLKTRKAEEIIPLPRLREEIRQTAAQFDEKLMSLPFFVYMRMKEAIAEQSATAAQELRERNG